MVSDRIHLSENYLSLSMTLILLLEMKVSTYIFLLLLASCSNDDVKGTEQDDEDPIEDMINELENEMRNSDTLEPLEIDSSSQIVPIDHL